jgi:hypothetical protein
MSSEKNHCSVCIVACVLNLFEIKGFVVVVDVFIIV